MPETFSQSAEFAARPEVSSEASSSSTDQEYYSLRTGSFQATEAPDPPPKLRVSIYRSLFVSLLVGIIAVAVVGWISVTRWLSPGQAFTWTVIGGVIPVIVLGVLAGWPSGDRKLEGVKRWAGLVPAAIVSFALVSVAGTWGVSSVREAALDLAPEDPFVLSTVARDGNDALALAGCRRLIAHQDDPDWRLRIYATLVLRSDLAGDCLSTLKDEEVRIQMTMGLADRWHAELLAPGGEEGRDRMCQLSAAIAELPLPKAHRDTRLLACGIEASSVDAQDCCLRMLISETDSRDELLSSLDESYEHVDVGTTSTGLVSMAFHQQQLTAPQKTFSRKLNLTEPAAQKKVLKLACSALNDGVARLTDHLSATVAGRCSVDPASMPTGPDEWLPVCDEAERLIREDELSPSDALCAATESSFTGAAVAAASQFVAHSIRSNERAGLGEAIDKGHERGLETMPDLDDFVAEMQDAYRNGKPDQRTVQRIMKKYDVSGLEVSMKNPFAGQANDVNPHEVLDRMADDGAVWQQMMGAGSEAEAQDMMKDLVGEQILSVDEGKTPPGGDGQ
jgi:hypothetical protein